MARPKKIIEYTCSECRMNFASPSKLNRHVKSIHEKTQDEALHKQNVANSRARSTFCLEEMNKPLEIDYSSLKEQYTQDVIGKHGETSGIVQEYKIHHQKIFNSKPLVHNVCKTARDHCKDVKFIFNVPLPPILDPSDEQIKDVLKEYFKMIIARMRFQWKLGIHIGGILEKINDEGEVGRHQYFGARNNFNLIKDANRLPTPYLFQSKETAEGEFASLIDNVTLSRAVNRTDTKSVMVVITNVHYVVYETEAILDNAYRVGNFAIPMFPKEVDEFIKKKRCVQTPRPSSKLDCVWKCLEMSLDNNQSAFVLEEKFRKFLSSLYFSDEECNDLLYGGLRLFKKLKAPENKTKENVKALDITVTAMFEECFNINLYIYTLSEEDITDIMQDLKDGVRCSRIQCTGVPLYTSPKFKRDQQSVVLLVQWEDSGDSHCYLINDIKQFFSQYRCRFCTALFKQADICQRHQESRSCLSPFVYPGGVHHRSKSVWEQCKELNIDYEVILGTDAPRFDQFVTFDIETALNSNDNRTRNTEKEQVLGTHSMVSLAYKSNIPGMEDTRFINIWDGKSEEEVFEEFYNDACKMQRESEKIWHKFMQQLYAHIEMIIISNGGQCQPTIVRLSQYPRRIQQDFKYICQYYAKEKKKELTQSDKAEFQKRFTRCGKHFEGVKRTTLLQYSKEEIKPDSINQVLTSHQQIDEKHVCKEAIDTNNLHEGFDEQKSYVRKLLNLLNQLKRYGSVLPVVAYNSSYDLHVTDRFWTKRCITTSKQGNSYITRRERRDAERVDSEGEDESTENEDGDEEKSNFDTTSEIDDGLGTDRDKIVNVIKNSSRYKSITTRDGLQFLDLMNYLPAGTSLDKAVRDYKVKDSKAVFPYKILAHHNLAGVKITTGSSYDMFNDNLKAYIHRVKHNTLEEDWAKFMKHHHTWTVQPLIMRMADDFSSQSDTNINEWLDILGYHDPKYQKQKTLDLESFQSNFIHLMPNKESSPLWRTKQMEIPRTGFEVFYNDFIKVCRDHHFENFLQYLKYYNSKDVEVMHPLIAQIGDNFRGVSKTCELFRGNISLPHISRNIGYEFAEREGAKFHLCKGLKEGEQLERKIRRNLAGGPSIIFNRQLQVGDAIPGTMNEIKIIKTYDANALYSKCMQYNLPVGANVHLFEPGVKENFEEWLVWKRERGRLVEEQEIKEGWIYKKLGKTGLESSDAERTWISCNNDQLYQIWERESKLYEEKNTKYLTWDQCEIMTQRKNNNTPIRIGCGISPDGVRYRHQFTDLELNMYPDNVKGIVYEFLGDYFHGNPSLISKKQLIMNSTEDLSLRKKYQDDIQWLQKQNDKTFQRFHRVVDMGFIIKFIWEEDYRKHVLSEEGKKRVQKIECPPYTLDFLNHPSDKKQDYLKKIADPVQFMALLMKDFEEKKIITDEEQKIAFFGLAEVDISLPKERHSEHDAFPSLFVRGPILEDGECGNNLRGLFSARKVVLITPYLQYLIHIGYVITRVYRAWECHAKPVLRPFIDRVVEERQKGDISGGNPMLANTYKLVGNSFYGGSLMCKDRHSQIRYVNNFNDLRHAVNKPFFINNNIISKDVIEIEEVSKKIKQNIPIQLGKWILDHAKIRMAMFEHSILRKFCDPEKYSLISMDTDSFTLAIAGNDIKEIVHPECIETWSSIIQKTWFVHEPCTKQCDPSHCNKRVPGPMKEEYSGHRAIALSSKLFCVSNIIPGIAPKVATKGLKRRAVHYDPLISMKKTLDGDEPMQAVFGSLKRVNIIDNGMNMRVMATTKGIRQVSNVYKKRRLNFDNITTTTIKGTAYCGTPVTEQRFRFLRQELEEEKQRKKGETQEEIEEKSEITISDAFQIKLTQPLHGKKRKFNE